MHGISGARKKWIRRTRRADLILSALVNILIESEAWEQVEWDIPSLIEAVLRTCEQAEDEKETAVVLTDDARIREMNRLYRGKDKPTNVLSFPSDEADEWGDLIISYDTIMREAEEQNKPLAAHACHMVVHGMLHLLGYDHEEDAAAEEMEAIEISILQQLGIENPYKNEYHS